jgi:hypothetical protein
MAASFLEMLPLYRMGARERNAIRAIAWLFPGARAKNKNILLFSEQKICFERLKGKRTAAREFVRMRRVER